MVLTYINGEYTVTGQNKAPEDMLKDMLIAVRILADDISAATGTDVKQILKDAASEAGNASVEGLFSR